MKTVLVAAMTADGLIGRTSDHLADWTSKADKQLFIAVTRECGVMAMGARTFATIGKALPGRRTIVYTTHPETITAASVETTAEPPAALVARLAREGAAGLAVVGGASIYAQFMAAGVVDEIYLTIAPLLFGTGVPLFRDTLSTQLQLLEHRPLDENTVLLHYKVVS